MKHRGARCAGFALACVWGSASAQAPPIVLGFDDVPRAVDAAAWATPLPATYGGLEWRGGELVVANMETSALFFPFAASSGSQSLYSGVYPADVQIRPQRGRFDFLGARFRTWGEAVTGTVSFSGWLGATKLQQAGPFVIDKTFRPIHLEWPGLDRLTIQSSGGYLMDDLRYRPLPADSQPEEATRNAGQEP